MQTLCSSKFNKLVIFIIIIGLIAINYTTFSYKSFIPGAALIIGILLNSLHRDSHILHHTKIWSSHFLNYAIICLGFGFNLTNILKAGLSGIWYTIISISATLIIGLLIGKFLKNPGKISTLISSGTAICGGSAIAAIAPIIRSSHEETTVAMGAIFLLNAIGLLIFPIIGHNLHLNQHQFGLLAALAIHDTSSVVGSCMAYGQTSLVVGTTIKLVRALWIIPVSIIIAMIYARMKHNEIQNTKTKKPWFILWFILASLLVTLFPQLSSIGLHLKHFGESLFMVALFLIGYNVSFTNLKTVGGKVLLQAVILWILVSIIVILALKARILY
ncbi:MAG: YeiH family protein [Neisseriaceae bacterium]